MIFNISTERLTLRELFVDDFAFILELVNTPQWIRFIGERNVKTHDDAKAYINKINSNPNITYWVVSLKEELTPIGIITFIKRDYLEHHDIGFAFLPQYGKNGYAYEASSAVLSEIAKNGSHQKILATTLKENTNSIKLLEVLGLRYCQDITVGEDVLLLYAADIETFIR